LVFGDKELDNSGTIGGCGIARGDAVLMMRAAGVDKGDDTCIEVILPSGKTITLSVKASDTIDSVKYQVQGKKNIPHKHQRLIYGGHQLESGSTVADHDIQSNGALMLLMSLYGGTKRKGAEAERSDKDGKTRNLRESIGSTTLRATASPGLCVPVHNLVAELAELNRRMAHEEPFIMRNTLSNVHNTRLSKLIDALGSSNNIKVRADKLKSVLFDGTLLALAEVVVQVDRSKDWADFREDKLINPAPGFWPIFGPRLAT
jgi:hypothetical protein